MLMVQVLDYLFKVRNHHAKHLEIINTDLMRISMQLALRPSDLLRSRCRAVGDESQEDQETEREVVQRMKAKLYHSPKTLLDLWHEYQFGLWL